MTSMVSISEDEHFFDFLHVYSKHVLDSYLCLTKHIYLLHLLKEKVE